MVHGPAAQHAAEYAAAHPRLSVGLHLDLAEWRSESGRWVTAYELVALDDAVAVADEVDRQLERFVALVGREPTHLDSHQHLHRDEPLRSIVRDRGRRLGIPVREQTGGVRYLGGFYGQGGKGVPWLEGIGVDSLCRLLRELPEGTTELGCHPGLGDDTGSDYGGERALEVATLCDPRVRETLRDEGIALRSFLKPMSD
jgi:chitin disaccharide deacetylase